jgi:hypothetical protein
VGSTTAVAEKLGVVGLLLLAKGLEFLGKRLGWGWPEVFSTTMYNHITSFTYARLI